MSEKEDKRILGRFFRPAESEDKIRKTFFDRIRSGNGPVRDFLKQESVTEETLSDEQQKLVSAFREGIAQALDIPPDYIKEEPVTRWVLEFTRAFVKPEFLKETITPPLQQLRLFGQEIGQIIREGIERIRIDDEPKKTDSLVESLIKEPPALPKRVESKKSGDETSDIAITVD